MSATELKRALEGIRGAILAGQGTLDRPDAVKMQVMRMEHGLALALAYRDLTGDWPDGWRPALRVA